MWCSLVVWGGVGGGGVFVWGGGFLYFGLRARPVVKIPAFFFYLDVISI